MKLIVTIPSRRNANRVHWNANDNLSVDIEQFCIHLSIRFSILHLTGNVWDSEFPLTFFLRYLLVPLLIYQLKSLTRDHFISVWESQSYLFYPLTDLSLCQASPK